MDVYKVVLGDYERTYYIVKGAESPEDAMAKVRTWYKENYIGDFPEWDGLFAEKITIKEGVTML